MRTGTTDAGATATPDPVRDRIVGAYADLGCPREVVERRFANLSGLGDTPSSGLSGVILVVGGDIGVGAMMLALVHPQARIVVVDPDLALPADLGAAMAGQSGVDAPATALATAEAAARRLGLADRMMFLRGGFSSPETVSTALAAGRDRTRVIGPRVCAEQGPFAAVLIDGLATSEATNADIRLAASALQLDGWIAVRGCIGERGSAIRAGVFEFLRYNADHAFEHPAHATPHESAGYLRIGRTVGAPAPGPMLAPHARESLSDLVALVLGDRPVLEVAVGLPLLGAEYRARGLTVRSLRLTTADWGARYFDPLIEQIVASLDHAPGSALFSGDLLDAAPDEMLAKLFARLVDRKAPVLLAVTPPGERGVSGPMSRPVARVIDLAASQGLSSFALAGHEIEAARHRRDRFDAGDLGATSRFASLVLFTDRTGWRDARGRSLGDLTPHAAAQREQIELQRIHKEAVLRVEAQHQAHLARDAERERDALRTDLAATHEAASAARRVYETELERLKDDLRRVQADLGLAAAARDRVEDAFNRETASRQTLEAELSRLKDEHEALSGQHAQAVSDRDAYSVQAAGELQKRQAAEARIVELEREVERVARQFAEAAAARDAALADLNRERNARAAAESDLKALGVAHTRLKDESEREIGALKAKLAIAEEWERSTLASIESTNAAHAEEIARYKESEATLSAAAASASRELDETRSSVLGQRDELSRLRTEAGELRQTLRRLEQDHVVLMQLHEERDSEDARLREALAQAARESDDHRVQGRAQAQRIVELEGELDSLRQAPASVATLAGLGAETATAANPDLYGIAAHLDLSQSAVDRLRAGDPAVDPASIAYPREDQVLEPGASAPDAVHTLHGRAADLSRDIHQLARELKLADEAREARLRQEWTVRDATHSAAVERMSAGHAVELGAIRQQVSDLKPRISAIEFAAHELQRSVFHTAGLSEDDLAPDMRKSDPDAVRERLARITANLESLHHVLEARLTARETASEDQSAEIPPANPVIAAETAPTSERRLPARSRPDGVRLYVHTYLETVRLVDLRARINRELAPMALKARLFDPDIYRSAGAIAPYTDPLRHYLERGEAAGRRPLALFDPGYYRANNPDADAGGHALLLHFFSKGVRQGRAPSAELSTLPALADAAGMSALAYFVRAEQQASAALLARRDRAAAQG